MTDGTEAWNKTMKTYAQFVTSLVMKAAAYVRHLTTGYIMPVMVGRPERLSNSVHKDTYHIRADHVAAKFYRWMRVMGSSCRTIVMLLIMKAVPQRELSSLFHTTQRRPPTHLL